MEDKSETGTQTIQDLERRERESREKEIEDTGWILKVRIAERKGEFSETIPLNPDGSLQLVDNEGNLKSWFAHLAYQDENVGGMGNPESLYRLAKEVGERFPELKFGFEQDPGRSIKYTVKENRPQRPS